MTNDNHDHVDKQAQRNCHTIPHALAYHSVKRSVLAMPFLFIIGHIISLVHQDDSQSPGGFSGQGIVQPPKARVTNVEK